MMTRFPQGPRRDGWVQRDSPVGHQKEKCRDRGTSRKGTQKKGLLVYPWSSGAPDHLPSWSPPRPTHRPRFQPRPHPTPATAFCRSSSPSVQTPTPSPAFEGFQDLSAVFLPRCSARSPWTPGAPAPHHCVSLPAHPARAAQPPALSAHPG